MLEERARHRLGRGADVHEDRDPVGDLLRHHAGDGVLLLAGEAAAVLVAERDHAGGDHGAAVDAGELADVAELAEVAADGLGGDAEMRGEALDRHLACFAGKRQDLGMTEVLGHEAVISPPPWPRNIVARGPLARAARHRLGGVRPATDGRGGRRHDARARHRPGDHLEPGHRLRRAHERRGERPGGVPAALPTVGLGRARPRRHLGLDRRRLPRRHRAGGRRPGRHRRHRHHQPARDDAGLGPRHRPAARPRHRLAGPAHRASSAPSSSAPATRRW